MSTDPTMPAYPPMGATTGSSAGGPVAGEVAAAVDAAVAQARAASSSPAPHAGGPVRVSTILGQHRTVAAPIGEELLEVTYRLAENTPDLGDRLADVQAREDGEAATELVYTFLERAVVSWELYADDGTRLPCNREVFLGRHASGTPALPNALLRSVFLTILGDDGGVGPKAPGR